MAKYNKGGMHPSRIFRTPEEMYEAFKSYKNHLEMVESLKWEKVQYVGKEGLRMTDNYKLPLTLEGFEVYCYENYGQVSQYFENKGGYYDDFVGVCKRIRTEIRENQITGGMLGLYNPSITQRLNGLVDKQEIKVEDETFNYDDMPSELLEEISKYKKKD